MQPAQSDSCATGPRPSPLCEVGHVINGEEDPHTLNPNHSKKPEVDQKIQSIGDELVPLYCVLPNGEKTFVIMAGSFAALFSPLSSSIYLPALPSLASDMNVSVSLINLTITTYLVMSNEVDKENMKLIISRYSKDSHLLSLAAFLITMDAVRHISSLLPFILELILASLCKTTSRH